MANNLPEARAGARSWYSGLGNLFSKSLGIGFGAWALMLAIGLLSKAGCKNDAITYAKAIWPDAKCSAINTGCKDQDTAVCAVGTARYMCHVTLDAPDCNRIFHE